MIIDLELTDCLKGLCTNGVVKRVLNLTQSRDSICSCLVLQQHEGAGTYELKTVSGQTGFELLQDCPDLLVAIGNKRLKFCECTVQVSSCVARKLLHLWVQKRGFVEFRKIGINAAQVFFYARLDVL